ncbi:class I SAM-dependent methyltransferase [candidate division KSB1 bacterium]|nr:class I SAM-dependent methyltransferase [candidate division KSB1 bacterium]
MIKCSICDSIHNHKVFKVKEMMFGYRDEFLYFQCEKCKCLQIFAIPPNISKYYPTKYYSLSPYSCYNSDSIIKKHAKNKWYNYAVFNKSIIGKIIYKKYPSANLRSLSMVPINKNLKILDIGCGTGTMLYALKSIGFKNLLGIDPNIEKSIRYKNGLNIIKNDIYNLSGEWDIIMFHHSFEHMPKPKDVLSKSFKILKNDGLCIIRIPTVSSYAWEYYGVDWVELDAPRHYYLHSVASMKILAAKTHFEIKKIVYDSNDFQFWGSEQYKRGIPLYSNSSYNGNPSISIFTKKDIAKFKKKAAILNSINYGDRAIYYLYKSR